MLNDSNHATTISFSACIQVNIPTPCYCPRKELEDRHVSKIISITLGLKKKIKFSIFKIFIKHATLLQIYAATLTHVYLQELKLKP